MRERERSTDLEAELEHAPDGQRAAALDELLQVLAVDELEDDELLAVLLAAVDHRDDVRMRELCDRARLAPEALDVLRVAAVLLVQDLQCDVPLEQRVEGAVDGRHAARPDRLLQLVSARNHLAHSHQPSLPAAREPYASTCASASSQTPSASSSSASVSTSGQSTRIALPSTPALSSSRPRCIDASITACASCRRRLLRHAVLDELDREHRAEAANVADRGEALLPGEHPRPHRLADLDGALVQVLLLDHVEHGERGRLGDGVADVGAADGAVVRCVEDLRLPEHARERQPGGDRLRDRDDVGLDAGVLDREELARPGEAGLDLVGDQADAVLVADRP